MLKFFVYLLLLNTFFLNFTFAQNIKDLKVNGNKRLSVETIKVIGNINFNKEYNSNDLNELTKTFYSSGYFKDLSVYIKNDSLVIDLIENPIIEDIKIEGIKKESIIEALLNDISLKNRKPFTELFLNRDMNLIKNVLKRSGYYFDL